MKFCSVSNCDIAENEQGQLVWKRKLSKGEIANICGEHNAKIQGEKFVQCPHCFHNFPKRAAIQAIAVLKTLQVLTPLAVSLAPIQCPNCKVPLQELSDKLRRELRL